MAELQGKDFIARVRLTDGAGVTIVEAGQTCERIPAGKHGGTVSDALEKLVACGFIAPKPAAAPAPPPIAKPVAPSAPATKPPAVEAPAPKAEG